MPGPAEPSQAPQGGARPVAVFALGWTLLNGRTLHHIARRCGIWDRTRELLTGPNATGADAEDPLQDVVRLLEGVPLATVQDAVQDIFIRPQGGDAVREIQRLGFAVGVATSSVHPAAERARDAFGLDFAVGVELETTDEGILTGKLAASPQGGACGRVLCKRSVLEAKRAEHAAPFTVAVGDAPGDACMLEAADLGIAVERAGQVAREAADVVSPLGEVPDVVQARVKELGVEVVERR